MHLTIVMRRSDTELRCVIISLATPGLPLIKMLWYTNNFWNTFKTYLYEHHNIYLNFHVTLVLMSRMSLCH